MNELFRPEAVAHQQQKLLGAVLLRQAWSTRLLTAFFGLVIAGLLVVFFRFGFARSATLSGVLAPASGWVEATSPQAGVVTDVKVHEGQQVNADDLLFVLSGERRADREQTHQRVADALAEQARLIDAEIDETREQSRLREQATAHRLGQLGRQLAQIGEELALQRRRESVAETVEHRYADLARQRAISQQTVDEKVGETLEQRVRTRALERDRIALQAERDALEADLRELPSRLQRDIAALQGRLTGVQQAQAEKDAQLRWEVRAPRAGRVSLVGPVRGQSVAAGEPLASLVPEGEPLEAVFYAPSKSLGLLRVDQPVKLRFDALPYQRFGQFSGRVSSLSRSPVPIGDPLLALAIPSRPVEPMYRVRVQLAGDAAVLPAVRSALQPGMRVEATAMLEHRRFYEWALGPAIGLKERLQ